MNFVEGARRGYVPRICLSQASYSTDARTHSPQLLVDARSTTITTFSEFRRPARTCACVGSGEQARRRKGGKTDTRMVWSSGELRGSSWQESQSRRLKTPSRSGICPRLGQDGRRRRACSPAAGGGRSSGAAAERERAGTPALRADHESARRGPAAEDASVPGKGNLLLQALRSDASLGPLKLLGIACCGLGEVQLEAAEGEVDVRVLELRR
eukprot:scaffold602_cov298-Pinguiococcus_pyrenoidosus.AAC.44